MIYYFSLLLSIFAALIFTSCGVGIFRSKDFFSKLQHIKNLGLYAINILIFAWALNYDNPNILVLSFLAIILNILAVNLLMQLAIQCAHKEGIEPDSKKKSLIRKKKSIKKDL